MTNRKKRLFLLACCALLAVSVIGGTFAYLMQASAQKVNAFTPAQVSCNVDETFDGRIKTNVNVQSTSDIDAYLRVRLVSYRQNAAGEKIGGTAPILPFTLGEGWFYQNGFYYYNKPVAPGESPAADLLSRYELTEYTDADGGVQVLEILAEAIQANPATAVAEAWGVTVTGGTLS